MAPVLSSLDRCYVVGCLGDGGHRGVRSAIEHLAIRRVPICFDSGIPFADYLFGHSPFRPLPLFVLTRWLLIDLGAVKVQHLLEITMYRVPHVGSVLRTKLLHVIQVDLVVAICFLWALVWPVCRLNVGIRALDRWIIIKVDTRWLLM